MIITSRSEGNIHDKKNITSNNKWFYKIIATLWVFCMLFFSTGIVMGQVTANRNLQAQANILTLPENMRPAWLVEKGISFLFEPVKAGAIGSEFLQIAQLNYSKLIARAAAALTRALLSVVTSYIKKALDAIQKSVNQFTTLVNSSGVAQKLLATMGGLLEVCNDINVYVDSNFNAQTASIQSPLEIAFNGISQKFSNTPIGTVSTTIAGKALNVGAQEVDINKILQDELDRAIRDSQNQSGTANDRSACVSKIFDNTKIPNSNLNFKDTYRSGLYAAAMDASITTNNDTVTPITNQLANLESAYQNLQNNNVTDNNQLYALFTHNQNDVLGLNAQNGAKARTIIEKARDGAKKATEEVSKTITGGDSTLAVVTTDNGVIPNTYKSPAPTIIGKDCTNVGSTEFILSDTNDSLCVVLVENSTPPEVVASSFFDSINQRSNAGSAGGEDLTSQVVSVINSFLDDVFSLFKDYIFGFVNNIAGGFCGRFNIASICNSLTESSKNWVKSIRTGVENLKINGTQYNNVTNNTGTDPNDTKPTDNSGNTNDVNYSYPYVQSAKLKNNYYTLLYQRNTLVV
jgi:hypothetical protein